LTLRYAPTEKSILPRLEEKNFTQQEISKNPVQYIEESLIQTISAEMEKLKGKIAISLSSGVDSTLVLSILRKLYPDTEIDSISVKFADSIDESAAAAKIAEEFHTNHHVLFVENFLEELPKAISIVKLPFWDLHWYHVAKKVKTLCKVFFSGDGGDELFGGYTFRYDKYLNITRKDSTSIEKVKNYLNCHERDWVPDQDVLFSNDLKFTWNEIYKLLEPYFDNTLPLLSQVFLADFNGKLLYNMLPLYSNIHDYFQIKNITPLLSEQLISFATHLPIDQKYNHQNKTGKILLLKLLEKYKTSHLISRKKQGFSVDTLNLWNSYGKQLCEYYLDNARIVNDNIINSEWIQKHIKKPSIDVRYVNKFLGLLALEIWYRLHITHEMDENERLTV
jgi:asparagine synthase (glutamine-hydrolysing)